MAVQITIIVLLSILLAVSTFITTKGKLTDDRRKGFHALKKNGWTLISINMIILLLLIIQFLFNENTEAKKNEENIKNQAERDSILAAKYDSSLLIIKSRFDSSNIEVISTIAEGLGKYGFMFDSANKSLIKLVRDSSKTKVIVPDDPVLFCSDFAFYDRQDDFSWYKITFTSLDASCSNFNLICGFFGVDSTNQIENLKFIGFNKFLTVSDKIPKDMSAPYYYRINNDSLYSMLYFRLYGTYQNLDQTKTFPIDDSYFYNFKSKTCGRITGNSHAIISNLFNIKYRELEAVSRK
ncbi:MAG: hypothetical protein JXR56_02960 [Candidatus Cloacimonetes bacterium]|nr:hypothetical protein [Candidatus Cloacimonadota bacterium]